MQYEIFKRLALADAQDSRRAAQPGSERLARLQAELDERERQPLVHGPAQDKPTTPPPRRGRNPFADLIQSRTRTTHVQHPSPPPPETHTTPAKPQPAQESFVSPLLKSGSHAVEKVRPSPLFKEGQSWPKAVERGSSAGRGRNRKLLSWYKGHRPVHIRVEGLSNRATWLILLASYLALCVGLFIDSSGSLQHSYAVFPTIHCVKKLGCSMKQDQSELTAKLDSIPPMRSGGFMRVEGEFSYPIDDGRRLSDTPKLKFSVEMLVWSNAQWKQVYSSHPTTKQLSCSPKIELNLTVCSPVVLADVFFDQPGLSQGSSKAEMKFHFFQAEVDWLTSHNAQFTVWHQSDKFAFLLKVTRLVLLSCSTFLSIFWFKTQCTAESHFCNWIPERQTLTLMLFSLAIYQNPVLTLVEWLPSPPVSLLMTADIVEGIGLQLLWFSWLLLVSGLKCYVKPIPRTAPSPNTRRRVIESGPQFTYGALPHSSARTLPPHHPHSPHIWSFVGKKVLLLACSIFIVVLVSCLRYPDLCFSDPNIYSPTTITLAYSLMLLLLLATTIGWVLWCVRSTILTGQELAYQPYVATRFAQLAYRIIVLQALLAVFSFALSYVFQIFRLGELFYVNWIGNSHKAVRIDSDLHLESWAATFAAPPGKLLFISSVCYSLVFIFLPPNPNAKPLCSYTNLEDNHFNIQLKASPEVLSPCFCLELACWLMEVSWQTYFDAHSIDTRNAVGGQKMHLESLGLHLEHVLFDQSTQSYGILARGRNRLVLAWRGTASTSSMVSDLAAATTPVNAFTNPILRCAEQTFSHVPVLNELFPRAHPAYWDSFQRVKDEVRAVVTAAMERECLPLFVTGHSLGGALAVLSAYDLEANLNLAHHVTVYTFGAPCIGNKSLSHQFDSKLKNYFRVAVDGDPITQPPLALSSYTQSGIQVMVDSHCLGNMIVAPTTVETLFRLDPVSAVRPVPLTQSRNSDALKSHRLRTYRECLEACFDEREFLEYKRKSKLLSDGRTSSTFMSV